MSNGPVELEAIRVRLINAGYPRPGVDETEIRVRESSREAQDARAELRAHIVDDIWALLDEVAELRSR